MAAPKVIAVVTRQSEQVTVRAPNGTAEGGGTSALNSARLPSRSGRPDGEASRRRGGGPAARGLIGSKSLTGGPLCGPAPRSHAQTVLIGSLAALAHAFSSLVSRSANSR